MALRRRRGDPIDRCSANRATVKGFRSFGDIVHPVVVLAPALALILVPRLWVGHVLKQHNQRDLPGARSARELARELLDRHWLQTVKVQTTDFGDHYDPEAKAVRLSRDKIDRRTLTALTTAAHEVSHAIQDSSGYRPFVWRSRLVKVARVAGEVGSVLFLAVPISLILSRRVVPPVVIGLAALAMLGTGVIAQLAALPSEIDASFGRALPMLRDGYIGEQQAQDARKILLACSLTYIASSMVAILHIWPWLGFGLRIRRQPIVRHPRTLGLTTLDSAALYPVALAAPLKQGARKGPICVARSHAGETLPRRIAKSAIRSWFRLTASF